jgi:hypothetical protein
MPETPSQASYAVREVPNAVLYTALFLNRSEIRGLVKTFSETFFKGALLFTFAAFVTYIGDRANEGLYLTAINWKAFLSAGVFLNASIAAFRAFYVGQHARSEQLKRYQAIAKSVMAESEKRFQKEAKSDQRSESRVVSQPELIPALRSETRTIQVPIQSAKPDQNVMGFVRSALKSKDLVGREIVVI